MNIAIIPARGGSKRIPRKNIKLFHGKPMIAYAIHAAMESACFDKIIVSTDDPEIAEVAVSFGASVPFVRPAHLADDHATTIEVINHAIDWCDNHDLTVKLVCCIYPTVPFMTGDLISAGLDELNHSDTDYVFTAASFPFSLQRSFHVNESNDIQMFSPKNQLMRSQDLQQVYYDVGQFYWGKRSTFLEALPIYSHRSRVILLSRWQAIDIDSPEDWQWAEKVFQLSSSVDRKI